MDRPDEVIWQFGDPWRDLRPDITAAGTATVVTEHLTTHLLDLHQRRTTRMTSVLSAVLTGDGDARTLLKVELATPCGLVTRCDPIERSQWSTPLILALAGLRPDWAENHLNRLGTLVDRLPP